MENGIMEDRIRVQPRIILGSFPLKAGEISLLGKKRELGPFHFKGDEAVLEVNGSPIARGVIRLTENGAEFTIGEMEGKA